MASGDTIAVVPAPAGFQAPASDPLAQLVCDPSAGIAVSLLFPYTSPASAAFNLLVPRQYGGGGLTVTVAWYSPVASGNVKWAASVARLAAGTVLSSAPPWGVEQSAYSNVGFSPRGLVYTTISFSAAQLAGIQRGELFLLRIRRDNTVSGNATNDANLIELLVKEQ
jgi:hypothetical protein